MEISEIEHNSRWEEVNNAVMRIIRMDRKHSSFDLIDETNRYGGFCLTVSGFPPGAVQISKPKNSYLRCRVKLKIKYGQTGVQPTD